MASFLLLHGLGGSGPAHWQHWIAGRLRGAGHDVRFPGLPDPDAPSVDAWLAALDRERVGGEVVLCHSLGCLLWLHHRAQGGAPAERVLLVAPPCPDAGVPEIAQFFPVPITPDDSPRARLVCGDDDPYCPTGAQLAYELLAVPSDVLPGVGHINVDTGFGPWPALETWCLTGQARFEAEP